MIKLEIDLFAEINPKFNRCIPYRLYINDELMTERDYIWDNKTHYITEVVPLFIGDGTHTINIENLNTKYGALKINTIRINDKITTLINGKEFTI